MKLSREIIKIDIKKSWIVSLSWRTFIFLFTFFLCNLILGKTLTSYFVVENIKLTKLISIRLFQTTMKLHLFFEWLVMSFEMNFHVLKLIIFNYFSVIVFHQPFAGWEVSDFSVNTILTVFFYLSRGNIARVLSTDHVCEAGAVTEGNTRFFISNPFFNSGSVLLNFLMNWASNVA